MFLGLVSCMREDKKGEKTGERTDGQEMKVRMREREDSIF